jgi:probable HAF family extracellular repeat protein
MFLKKGFYHLLAAALMAAPAAALADPVFSVNFLPDGFAANALGDNGMVAGRIHLDTNGWAAAIYANGSVTRYDNLGISGISSINSSGMFTGSLKISNTLSHAFIYHDGVIQDIGTGTSLSTSGDAINASGQVALTAFNGPYGDTYLYSNGTMTALIPKMTYPKAWMEDMNESATVVGGTEVHHSGVHAFVYSNGVMTDLGAPDGGESWAYGVNNSDDVVGTLWGSDSSTFTHAFLYRDGVLQDLGTFGGVRSGASGIDNNGRIVGYVSTADGSYGFLYENGMALDLNTLVAGADGWTITGAREINEAGQILASACYAGGSCRNVLLNPVSAVPEPAQFALLFAGLAGIAARRRFPIRKKSRAAR